VAFCYPFSKQKMKKSSFLQSFLAVGIFERRFSAHGNFFYQQTAIGWPSDELANCANLLSE
jgi:hypothetical protein